MSMSREEIDLREKIAVEFEMLPIEYARVIGLVRKDIWHGRTCPCSKCQKLDIRSCSNTCSKLANVFPEGELVRLYNAMAHNANTLYYCGHCNNGRNEWFIDKMLFDLENEMAVTPCCHTEATEALTCYCIDGTCPADEEA